LPAVSYKGELKSISPSQSTFNDKFSFQFSSIKNFLFFVMNSECANGRNLCRSVSSRPKANIKDFFLSINGEAYPSERIETPSRMYSELLRSMDQICDTNAGGIISYTNYSITDTSTVASSFNVASGAGKYGDSALQQRFLAGIDLDRFSHSSDVLMSGTNSQGQMINLLLNFETNGSVKNESALNLYAFVSYDVIYNIQNGTITMRT
jgi:hypothetical protein